MKEQEILMPGYKVNEYLLILNPHQELSNRIIHQKQKFADEYHLKPHLTKPNISIVKFTQYELSESRIVANLHRLAMELKAIKIELQDYGSFPSHTIYINVTSRLAFQNLVKHIRSEAQKLMKFDEEHKPHFFLEPYIPIAQKIPQSVYEKAWQDYSHRHFTAKFIADSMLLLKRPKGELRYKIVERFQFENLLVGVSQGQLF